MSRRWLRMLGTVEPMTLEEAQTRFTAATSLVLVHDHQRLGPLLETTPVLRALHGHRPGLSLHMLSVGPFGDLLDGHPALTSLEHTEGGGAWLRRPPFLKRLQEHAPTLSLLLAGRRGSVIPYAAAHQLTPGAVVGMDVGGADDRSPDTLLDCAVPPPEREEPVHPVDEHLDLLEALGVRVTDRRHWLPVPEESRERGVAHLSETGLDPRVPALGIDLVDTASSVPAAGAAQHARDLGFEPVLLADDANAEAREAVRQLGRTDLRELSTGDPGELAGLVATLAYTITDRSDTLHLAAAVGTPCAYVGGDAPSWTWAPYGPHVLVWSPAENDALWPRMEPRLREVLSEHPDRRP